MSHNMYSTTSVLAGEGELRQISMPYLIAKLKSATKNVDNKSGEDGLSPVHPIMSKHIRYGKKRRGGLNNYLGRVLLNQEVVSQSSSASTKQDTVDDGTEEMYEINTRSLDRLNTLNRLTNSYSALVTNNSNYVNYAKFINSLLSSKSSGKSNESEARNTQVPLRGKDNCKLNGQKLMTNNDSSAKSSQTITPDKTSSINSYFHQPPIIVRYHFFVSLGMFESETNLAKLNLSLLSYKLKSPLEQKILCVLNSQTCIIVYTSDMKSIKRESSTPA